MIINARTMSFKEQDKFVIMGEKIPPGGILGVHNLGVEKIFRRAEKILRENLINQKKSSIIKNDPGKKK